MASFNHDNNNKNNVSYVSLMSSSSGSCGFDPSTRPNTTFVQTDPSTFRAVVQKLTGASPKPDPSAQKLSLTVPTRLAGRHSSGEKAPLRPPFKLHERRTSARKLEIKLNNGAGSAVGWPSTRQGSFLGFGNEIVMVSPISPLDLLARGSPTTPTSPSEEEERAIAEKGFYLHQNPLSTARGSKPPELLPLFPLHSPRDDSSSSS